MPEQDIQTKARELAQEVLRLARNTLLAELRFLDVALCRLAPQEAPDTTLVTDGQSLRYGFVYVLRRWQADRALLIRGYLHTVLHCIYHHPFVDKGIDPLLWDLACDIAVEASIDALDLPSVRWERPPEADQTLRTLRKALKDRLTAERIYRWYAQQALSGPALEALRTPFCRDEHTLWYERSEDEDQPEKAAEEQTESTAGQAGGQRQPQEGGEEQPGTGDDPKRGDPKQPGSPQAAEGQAKRREEAKAQWEQIAQQVRSDLETHSRKWGDRAGSLLHNLREGSQKKLHYEDFLRQFAVLSEVLRVDEDHFDYIFYTYGMQLYGNMPLVEPLEYAEAKRVRDFVIVLDTSASVQGAKVQRFVEQTCQLLLQEETYDTRMELHVLECDAQVQRDVTLRSAADLEAYLKQLQFTGGGGTDFRPAFAHIERLRTEGALPELRGILYFTDGDGTYPPGPPSVPDCKVAFVFADPEDAAAQAPPWAIKILLDPDSLDGRQILYIS